MTYIDALPCELRTELKYYHQYPIWFMLNEVSKTIRLSIGSSAWHKSTHFLPYEKVGIKFEIVKDITKDRQYCYVLHTQSLILDKIIELCNMIIGRPFHDNIISQLNKQLRKFGYKEQILLYIHDYLRQHYILLPVAEAMV